MSNLHLYRMCTKQGDHWSWLPGQRQNVTVLNMVITGTGQRQKCVLNLMISGLDFKDRDRSRGTEMGHIHGPLFWLQNHTISAYAFGATLRASQYQPKSTSFYQFRYLYHLVTSPGSMVFVSFKDISMRGGVESGQNKFGLISNIYYVMLVVSNPY